MVGSASCPANKFQILQELGNHSGQGSLRVTTVIYLLRGRHFVGNSVVISIIFVFIRVVALGNQRCLLRWAMKA
jgi:hypothetical protein